MMRRVQSLLPSTLLQNFSIGRAMKLFKENTKKIYWTHNLPGQMRLDVVSESEILRNQNRFSFLSNIVFVSEWQKEQYIKFFKFSEEEQKYLKVLKNAVPKFNYTKKSFSSEKPIKLIYMSVPERGLNILYHAFIELSKKYNIELEVYSSYKIYGNPQRDQEFQGLFNLLKSHPKIKYSGSVSNDIIREKLKTIDIFAYPSTYVETSCICLIESLYSGCLCVHPDLGALKETSGGFSYIYSMPKSRQEHVKIFSEKLEEAILDYINNNIKYSIEKQYKFCDEQYNLDTRILEWKEYLEGILLEDRKSINN